MMKLTMALVIALAATFPLSARIVQAPPVVDYDTFMQQDVQGRLRLFNQVTAENRAELVQTQIKRWVEKNRARLTPEQLDVMAATLAFVTADRYRVPTTEAQRAQAQEMEARTAAVFAREDIMQAMTIRGDYIPKKN